jgi:two-component system nitrate/nitrite response regulator NarP
MIRVALYSDEPVAEVGLRTMLSAEDGITVVQQCARPAQLLTYLSSNPPDVVLLDMAPHLSLGLIQEIRSRVPDCKIVLWTREISTEWAFQAIELGVRGILAKTLPASLHIKCLQKVCEGELWLAKNLTQHLLEGKPVELTHREGQLVSALAQGLKNKEIAELLGITEGTVKVYLSRLFQKTGVKDRFELALQGLKNLGESERTARTEPVANGWVEPADAGSVHQGTLRRLVLTKLGELLIALVPSGLFIYACGTGAALGG